MRVRCGPSPFARLLPAGPPGPRPAPPARPRAGRAFTVIELMLAMSIMGVIVYALYATFSHTQRALRANVSQVDVMEAGRSAMDSLVREVSQLTATGLPDTPNFTNGLSGYAATLQPLLGNGALRTNVLHELYFVSRQNQDVLGSSYRVLYASNGVGTLSFYTTNLFFPALRSNNLILTVTTQPASNYVRLADGVVHFRVRTYDPDGRLLLYASTNASPAYRIRRLTAAGGVLASEPAPNVILREDPPGETKTVFYHDALPAYVEVELGVLEPHTFEQYKSFAAGSDEARRYLERQAGKVQLFQQRIPIRTASR